MSRNDELNSRAEMIEEALQEGYAKGLDEGLAKGVIKGRADAAKRMIASGMTKEQAAAILELSTKEIDIVLAS